MFRPPKILGLALATLLLCHCATKHQPREFPAYFPTRPENQFSSPFFWERRELDNARRERALSQFENKRLWELTLIEMRSLKKGCPRHEELNREVQALSDEVRDLDTEVKATQAEVQKYRDPNATPASTFLFETPGLKALHQAAYNLWNKDQNEAALEKVNEILRNAPLVQSMTAAERFKLHSLRFRVALDVNDLKTAEESYAPLREYAPCGAETAVAGFLVALHSFSRGDNKRALQLLETQCDPDLSPSNLTKRKYWQARFSEPQGAAAAAPFYDHVLRSKMPGYYVYLAKSRLGKKIELPAADPDPRSRPYLNQEFSVSGEVRDLLELGEARLTANLRRDAAVFLTRAAQLLKSDVKEGNIFPLLYTAHLLQAAGNHLEAMKVYSVVTTALQEDLPSVRVLSMDFLREMFPRPFAPSVEWLSRLWGTDPDFIYAIMRQESAFNPAAVSITDARGLMQLMPFVAKSLAQKWRYQSYYSDKLLFHAEENLKLATYHLFQLRGVAPHLVLMAASYNAGLSRVSGWWKKYGTLPLDVFVELIPVNETRNYVKLVLRNYFYYKALRQGGALDPNLIPFQLPPYPQNTPAGLTASARLQQQRSE